MNLQGWPFPITVLGDVGSGGPAQLIVDLGVAMTPECFERLAYAVDRFVALAQAGGLGGDRIPPDRVVAELGPTAPPRAGARAQWDLARLGVDLRGLGVLFDAIALLADAPRGLTLTAGGLLQQPAFGPEELSPAWPSLPFAIDDDRTGPNVELEIELVERPDEAQTAALLDAVGVWLDCGSIRGYRDPTGKPDGGYLAPIEDPRFRLQGTTLAALLHDSGVLEQGYDILLNVLCRLHATVPIARVELL
ncbi:MAG: hypothetical protein K1X88_34495 [Nannocystaceae bacterium]|nr:hypothetical protein [Nannocystaceae bacterium]